VVTAPPFTLDHHLDDHPPEQPFAAEIKDLGDLAHQVQKLLAYN